MHRLPASTVKLITSTQVITSANSVVKELLENSIDAGATSIEIKLDNYGFDKIEVRDNGGGVSKNDIQHMAVPHYTSKLVSSEDLECLNTYGFRGEALGSLCSVSDVTVITKTKEYDISTEYSLDHKGQIVSSKPSHLGQGTTVSVANIFKNLPVRKQFHNNTKRKKATLKEIEDLVLSYGVVCPNVRLVLRHNKDLLWQKNPVSSSKMVLHSILGSTIMNQLQHVEKVSCDPEITVEGYLPKCGSNINETGRSNTDRSFIYVNSRPVILKNIEKILKQYYSTGHNLDPPKHPVGYLHVKIPSKEVDVNLDPNKTKVMLHHKEDLEDMLKCLLEEIYRITKSEVSTTSLDAIHKDKQSHDQDNAPDLPVIQTAINNVSADTLVQPVHVSMISERKTNVEKEQCDTLQLDNLSSVDLFDEEILFSQNRDVSEIDYVHQKEQNISGEIKHNNEIRDINDSNTVTEKIHTISVESRIDCTKASEDVQAESNAYIPSPSEKQKSNTKHTINTDINIDINSNATVDSLSEDVIKSVAHTVSNTLPSDNKEPKFNVSGDFDEILSMDIETPEKANVQVTSSDWCKGTSVCDKDGGIVQPVQLLVPEKKNAMFGGTPKSISTASPGFNTSIRKSKLGQDVPGQATLYDVMSSVKRPTTAYIYFSKEIRPKVVEENPNCSFEEIAKIIGEKWKSLSDIERQKYEELMTKDVERYKEEKSLNLTSRNMGVPAKKRKTEISSPCVQKLFTSSRKSPNSSKHKAPTKTVSVPFSMSTLKERMNSSHKWELTSNNIQIIGPVESLRLWVVINNSKLELFQPVRAKELLIYRSLLENYELPLEKQDPPILLTKSTIKDPVHWQTLLTMRKTPSTCYTYYTDERLEKNGFRIRQYWDQGTEDIKVEIESMTNCMNFFGTGDLIEILSVISKNKNESNELSASRSTKIQHYLQGEAVRICRKILPKFSRKDCEDLIDCLKENLGASPLNVTSCFHNKPFLISIYDLNELQTKKSKSLSHDVFLKQ